ncbi:unnamed protein product, partial [Polarella glacialis]
MLGAPAGGSVLQVGGYCGYSAIRMAWSCPTATIASLEIDPVHVMVARILIAFAGLDSAISVWTGHSKDLIPRLALKKDEPGFLSAVFFDTKGSRYHEELAALSDCGALKPGAVVVAENVLKPGAPVFLWQVVLGKAFATQALEVQESDWPPDDWMSVSAMLPPFSTHTIQDEEPRPLGRFGAPPPHSSLLELLTLSDRMRDNAVKDGRSAFSRWAVRSAQLKEQLLASGLVATRIKI